MYRYRWTCFAFFMCLLFTGITACGGGGGGSDISDTTAPAVDLTTPVDGATGVSVNSSLSVVFNEAMDPSTFTTGTCLSSHGTFSGFSFNTSGDIITLTPNAPFPYDTTVSVTITAGVTDGAGNSLPGDHTWSFETEQDLYAPMVSSTNPAIGTTGVELGLSAVTATFNESMDGLTIDGTTFTVGGLTGTVSYDDQTRTATFSPSGNLVYGQVYSAMVGTGVTDSVGNHLAAAYTWSFTAMEDTVPPAVDSVSPMNSATDVSVGSTIAAVFSEAMDPLTINSSTFLVGGVTGSVTYNASTHRAVFSPGAPLSYAATINATLTTGVRDLQGNPLPSEYSWSFTVESDTTPPTVVSTNPINDQSLTSVDTAIKAVFSEPMDPSTITSSTFQVLSVSGSVSYNGTTYTATFTPSSPLSHLQSYLAFLSTAVRDAQGNPLATNYQWSFETADQVVQVSGITNSDMADPALVFNDSGDGVAVWISNAGSYYDGTRVLYSLYDEGTQTWSTEAVLDFVTKATAGKVFVETNGSGFLAVWSIDHYSAPYEELKAAVYTPASGWTITTLDNYVTDKIRLASNGTGYATVWSGTSSEPTVSAIYNGSSWSVTELASGELRNFALASNGSSYCGLYAATVSVRALMHNGASWSSPSTIFTHSPGVLSSDISLVSNGTGYAAVWDFWLGTSTHETHGSVYESGSWTTTQIIPDQSDYDTRPVLATDGSGYMAAAKISTSTSNHELFAVNYSDHWETAQNIGEDIALPLDMASNGTGYAVVFQRTAASPGLVVNTYNGSSWLGTQVLEATNDFEEFTLVSAPPTYAATWVQSDGTGPRYSMFFGTAWSGLAVLDLSPDPSKNPTIAPANYGTNTGRYVAAWSQSDTIRLRHYRSGWLPLKNNLISGTYPGSALNPRIASSGGGLLMAVWEQYEGEYKSVWASYNGGTGWTTPYRVTKQGKDPEVATNGVNNFLIVYESTDLADRGIKARRYEPSAAWWSAQFDVGGNPGVAHYPRIVARGTEYGVVWNETGGKVLMSTSTDKGVTWTTAMEVSSRNADDQRILTNGTGYLVVYVDRYSLNDILKARLFDGTVWESEKSFGTLDYSEKWDAATDGTGYAVTWSDGDIYAATHDASSWSANEKINTWNNSNTNPYLTWGGTEYMLLWRRYSSTYSSTNSGSGWSAPSVVPGGIFGNPTFDGSGYVLISSKDDGSYWSLVSYFLKDGEVGGGDGYLENLDGRIGGMSLIRWGTSYLAGVMERDNELEAASEVWVIRGY